MSISPEFGKVILESEVVFAELEKVLFPMSLMGATIQDGGTRARRGWPAYIYTYYINQLLKFSCISVEKRQLDLVGYIRRKIRVVLVY